ncbi:MAG: hypothetical protein ACE5DX_04810 [Candidatus Dojkabacteria bacterium]
MKKSARHVFLPLITFVMFTGRVAAADIENPVSDAFGDVQSILESLSSLIQPAAILAFLAMIIYGGFTKLTAAGNPDQEAKSSKILTAGVIGFIIIVLAPLIVNIIGTLLGISSLVGTG